MSSPLILVVNVSVSVMEIYNETLVDLLQSKGNSEWGWGVKFEFFCHFNFGSEFSAK